MKTKAVLILVFLALLVFNCFGNDGVPVAISPGSNLGVGVVEDRCPTFSWAGVAWAQKYRVVVFGVEDTITTFAGEMKLTAKPLLSEDIAGGGLSWTPSASQGLAEGSDYAWYVGAMDASGAWAWSASRRFRVEASSKVTLIEGERSDAKEQVSKAEASDKAAVRAATGSSAEKITGKKGKVNDPAYGTEGTYSTFYGTGAGANNSSDTNANSFFGSGAGYSNTTGYNNTFMGLYAGNSNTTGIHNTFMGRSAGFSNTTGSANIFIGRYAGYYNTTGYSNTFIGNEAGHANTTGISNTFLGYYAGFYNTTGISNTFLGYYAGYSNTTGNYNTYLGMNAGLFNSTGLHNTFLGYDAGRLNTTGNYNTYLGNYAGTANTSGHDNTFIGYTAGNDNTGGYSNIFFGNGCGYSNTTGLRNTFIGFETGHSNTTGTGNVFLGFQAGYSENGSNKLFIDNGDTPTPLIYGDFSTDKVGINGWLGVGTSSPAYPMELKTSGVNAAIVANRSGGAMNYVNATDTFGNFGTVNNFPLRLTVNAAWKLRLNADNSLLLASGASCTAGGVWTNASSITLKQDIAPLNAETAAAALRELNPVTYAYKADASEKYVGFIAEEVPELVAMQDRKSLSPMDIVAVLTKVVQEQQKDILFLLTKLSALERKVEEKE